MRGIWFFVLGAVCGVVLMCAPKLAAHLRTLHGGMSSSSGPRAHTSEKFAFIANAPMRKVAPLFGADKERVWAPDWYPQFLHPLPAGDEEGMVFTVAHRHLHAAWVNTQFDLKNGRIQYVYVIPDALVTMITIQLTPQDSQTHVDVAYERTALSPKADGQVRHMAEGDRGSGPDWEKQINGYLQKTGSQ
jgi:hypothetical protein